MKRLLMCAIVLFFLVSWLALRTDNPSTTQAARLAEEVTFSKQIVRLMQNHCQRCHHEGGHAPFPLMTYEEAYPYARSIRAAVLSRRMPQGVSARLENGCGNVDTFEGPRRLTASEIATFAAWVEAGAPEGDRNDLPPPLTFTDNAGGHAGYYEEWQAGEPDIKLDNGPNGFIVPGGLYRDFFRRFPIKTNYESDRYFTSFEALVGTGDLGRQINIVHHVTLFIDPTCGSLEQQRAFVASKPEIPGAGFEGEFTYPTDLVGMWFPGANPITLPAGIGIKIPRGACLVMEVHYTTWQPDPVVDKTIVGLRWARSPVYYERVAKRISNENFVIPAGAKRYQVKASKTLDDPVTIYSLAPHMHQFGTDFVAEALLPSGEKRCLIDVEYDFKHQANYLLKEPIRLPAGTQLTIRAFYDNTADFPRQLNYPPIPVPFGPTSDKEMCQLTIGLTNDQELLRPSSPDIAAIWVDGERLVINGGDLRPGAFIEINGRLLQDTQMGERLAYAFSPAEWQGFTADNASCCCAAKAGQVRTNPLAELLHLAVTQPQGLITGCNLNFNARATSAAPANHLRSLAAACNCGNQNNDGKPLRIAVVNPDGGRTATRRFFPRAIGEGNSRVPR